jgi:hypothetical protein
VEENLGYLPSIQEIMDMEGMKNGEEHDDDLYMSDTGAEIVKATRERDMFEGTLRGRHGKTN